MTLRSRCIAASIGVTAVGGLWLGALSVGELVAGLVIGATEAIVSHLLREQTPVTGEQPPEAGEGEADEG